MTTTNDAPAPAPNGSMDTLISDSWQELCERDDRTSPPECPDMCLITVEEMAEFMERARALESFSPAPSGSGVRVKPLEWQDGYAFVTPWEGWYFIHYYGGPRVWRMVAVGFKNELREDFATEAEAKAAAQADYEARILSALASDASPRDEVDDRAQAMFEARFPNDTWERQSESIKNIWRRCAQRLYAHPAPATVESLSYQVLFNAIAAATNTASGGLAVSISVEKFRAALAPATEGRKG